MSDDLVKRLRELGDHASFEPHMHHTAADRIEELEAELAEYKYVASALDTQWAESQDEIADLKAKLEKSLKGLEIYERERNRYKHAKPEMTGAYFLAGGLGKIDDNYLPRFVKIVPAYGCGWSQVYEKTDKTIMYEGS